MRKTKTFVLRLTEYEINQWKKCADDRGIPLAQLVRSQMNLLFNGNGKRRTRITMAQDLKGAKNE